MTLPLPALNWIDTEFFGYRRIFMDDGYGNAVELPERPNVTFIQAIVNDNPLTNSTDVSFIAPDVGTGTPLAIPDTLAKRGLAAECAFNQVTCTSVVCSGSVDANTGNFVFVNTSDLTVGGTFTAQDANFSGIVTINFLDVGPAGLEVDGASTFNGPVDIFSTLSAGASTFDSIVTNGITCTDLFQNGTLQLIGTVGSSINLTGNITQVGNITQTGNIGVTGNITASGTITANTKLDSPLFSHSGSITIQPTVNLTLTTSGGDVDVTGRHVHLTSSLNEIALTSNSTINLTAATDNSILGNNLFFTTTNNTILNTANTMQMTAAVMNIIGNSASAVDIQQNSSSAINLTSTSVLLGRQNLQFNNPNQTPTIAQTLSGGATHTMTIAAQSTSGSNPGANLLLTPGSSSGGGFPGDIRFEASSGGGGKSDFVFNNGTGGGVAMTGTSKIGLIVINNISAGAPGTPSQGAILFAQSSHLKAKNAGGTTYDLTP